MRADSALIARERRVFPATLCFGSGLWARRDQGVQVFEAVGRANQIPLSANFSQTSQEKGPKSDRAFNVPLGKDVTVC